MSARQFDQHKCGSSDSLFAQALRKAVCGFAIALIGVVACGSAEAQQIMPKYRCADGEYRGPDTGKTRYVKDDFNWFVTRDFAKRFCMPERFIDDQLVGAEAMAWRVKPSDEAFCTLNDGKETCTRKNLFELDIYLKSNLALPKSDPEVLYFWNDTQPVSSSGEVISTNRLVLNAHLRREGQYREPAGGRPPFHAYSGPGENHRVVFLYLRAMPEGTLSLQTNLGEEYFRANWVSGLDLVSLRTSTALGLGTIDDPRNPHLGVRKFAIGVTRERKRPGSFPEENLLTRRDYAHVIEVPDKLGAMISAYDSKRWDEFIGPIKRAMSGQAPNPSDPPLVLPLRP